MFGAPVFRLSAHNAGPGYSNWLSGEPNNAFGSSVSEDFLAINLQGQFGWNDENEEFGPLIGYIVEYDNVVPEPATLLLLGTGLGAVAARRRLKKRA